MRVATVDIGTNTVLLLVADRQSDGRLREIAQRATITRLGAGVARTGSLAPAAVLRTRECLADFAAVVNGLAVDRVAVVGTSAMRDAGGGQEICAYVREVFGVEARVLPGAEEARLTFRGALSGLPAEEGDAIAVFDIGGGSTEVVVGRRGGVTPNHSYAESFDVGSVRLTERYLSHDPPTSGELDALVLAAEQAFAQVPAIEAGSRPVGVAGTMTTLAAVALGMDPYDGARVHGLVVDREHLRRVVHELASMDLTERRQTPGLQPERADVIVAGGFIALSLLDHWSTAAVTVSDRGVRWGLAEELVGA